MVGMDSQNKSVQELVKNNVEAIPDHFLVKNATSTDSLPFLELPVIDFSRLSSDEKEVEKLKDAFISWGCFRIINHGLETLVEDVRKDSKEFMDLPEEEKMKYASVTKGAQGYGNDKVSTEVSNADWIDRLYLVTFPENQRQMHLWPENPPTFKKTFHEFFKGANGIVVTVVEYAAKIAGLPEDIILKRCGKNPVMHSRINLYPPCPKPEHVFGLKEHKDGSVITILSPDEEVEGLQYHMDNQWYRVKPMPGTLEVVIGDQLQVFSNGMYKSGLHRAVINKEKERMVLVHLICPENGTGIGPIEEFIDDVKRPRLYKTIKDRDYVSIATEAYEKGVTGLEVMAI